MALRTRVEPIDRDIEVMLQGISPQENSAAFAEFAGEQIEDAKKTNETILGRMPRYTVSVDGSPGAPLAAVKPDGVIVVEFELINDVLKWIGDQLEMHSPVKSGRYKKSHDLFADGQLIAVGDFVPSADEFVFMNSVPYARKIESGSSPQTPDGVYQAVAVLASRRFGNIAKITFSFRGYLGGDIGRWAAKTKSGTRIHNRERRAEWLIRQPAVIVRLPR